MQLYSLTQSVAPAARVLTADELKLQIGQPVSVQLGSDEEAELLRIIDAATDWVEQHTARQLITATFVQRRTYFPTGMAPMILARSPLGSVSSITYYDDAATPAQQTWANTNYRVVGEREPPAIYLGWQDSYPAMTPLQDGIEITYTAGYGTASSDVPDLLRQCVLLMACHMYEHRSATHEGVIGMTPYAVEAIAEKYRVGDEFDGMG